MKQISKNAISNLEQYCDNIHIFKRTMDTTLQIFDEEEAWEEAAKSSFRVAKICLEIEEIPNSIFNFQQTVEKIAKTLLYSSSLYDQPEKGRHQPHILFEELYLIDYVEERDELGYEICIRCKKVSENNPSFYKRLQSFREIFSSIQEIFEECQCSNMSLANTFYYQYTTMALCFLFIDTEQNARYPEKDENGKMVIPTERYPLGLKKPLQEIALIIQRVFICMDSPLHL